MILSQTTQPTVIDLKTMVYILIPVMGATVVVVVGAIKILTKILPGADRFFSGGLQRGEQGEAGQQGVQGIQGIVGAIGVQGVAGTNGAGMNDTLGPCRMTRDVLERIDDKVDANHEMLQSGNRQIEELTRVNATLVAQIGELLSELKAERRARELFERMQGTKH